MRVAIVGGGIYGLCAAWALARAGHAVELFEQDAIPNERAASTDHHRLIRYPYGAAEGYARMVGAAFSAWRMLWQDLGQGSEGRGHYHETGTLALAGSGPCPYLDPSAATMARLHIAHELLDAEALAARFGVFAFAPGARGLFLPSGGILFARRIAAALAHHLPERGVTLHPGASVAAIEAEAGAITLAGGRRVAADALVIAAGAWTARLLPDLAARLTPSRQPLLFFAPPADLAPAWAEAPMLLRLTDGADAFYAVPPREGLPLKVGLHRFAPGTDPDARREITAAEAETLWPAARANLAGFSRLSFLGGRACYYTYAAGERFIAEQRGRSLVLSCCSGHGFKFAPLVALEAARALAGEISARDLAHWVGGERDHPPA
ncbi:MAG: FAD-dependent oxidoreductase [Alphaproteobacteria bacterium]|nr:FAD-dependent oxidoreductase [Alphaproteobacteria bacterium]